MDLAKALLKEHSRTQMLKIVDYVGQNEARFKVLVEVYLTGPYRITQRAAWPLSYCVEHHPALVKPHLRRLLDFLDRPDAHVAVKRNTMRLLQFVDLPKRFEGRVAEFCFAFLQSKSETIAVKVFAMSTLHRIVKAQPELGPELKIIIEDQLPYAGPAFRSRALKVLKSIS